MILFFFCYIGLTAWLCGDWVLLQILMSVPPLIVISYYWIIPGLLLISHIIISIMLNILRSFFCVEESVRWHLAKNQNIKAIKIIKQAAKTNGVQLTTETMKLFEKLEADENENRNSTDHSVVQSSNNGEIIASVRKMLQSRIMINRILILFYNFIINALVYFGLSLNSVSLSGNKYFNFILVKCKRFKAFNWNFLL